METWWTPGRSCFRDSGIVVGVGSLKQKVHKPTLAYSKPKAESQTFLGNPEMYDMITQEYYERMIVSHL